MSWENSHLHLFSIGEKCYSEPDPDGYEMIKRDKHALLSAVVLTEGMHFRYKYDFGGGWSHDITVEKIERLDPIDWITPRCVDGQRAAPLEDCGGIGGYTRLIDALYDPVHPEHTQLRTWAGP